MSQAPDTVSIRSFLVHVSAGRTAEVAASVAALPGCHVHPALNRDVLVVVAETHGREAADHLDAALAAVTGVEGVALVSGFAEDAR